jgi:DNA-binding XRE family transcriptional regulator
VRKNIKLPRILRIKSINDSSISLIFNNGESRIVDIAELLKKLEIPDNSPAVILKNPVELAKVKLTEKTLSWDNVEQYITLKNGSKIKVPFEIGPDILYKYSRPEETGLMSGIGKVIRNYRISSGMSQQELAKRSGTSRSYISRVENEKSDIELSTLRKIVETGLGKKFEIKIQ